MFRCLRSLVVQVGLPPVILLLLLALGLVAWQSRSMDQRFADELEANRQSYDDLLGLTLANQMEHLHKDGRLLIVDDKELVGMLLAPTAEAGVVERDFLLPAFNRLKMQSKGRLQRVIVCDVNSGRVAYSLDVGDAELPAGSPCIDDTVRAGAKAFLEKGMKAKMVAGLQKVGETVYLSHYFFITHYDLKARTRVLQAVARIDYTIADVLEKLKVVARAEKVEIVTAGAFDDLVRLDETQATMLLPVEDYMGAALGAVRLVKGVGTVTAAFESELRAELAILLAAFGVTAGLVVGILLWRAVRPIGRLVRTTRRLEEGHYAVTVPFVGRDDEIGELALAVEGFRQAGQEKERMEAEQRRREEQALVERRAARLQLAKHFETTCGQVVASIAEAVDDMRGASDGMSRTAAETEQQAGTVATIAERTSSNVQMVATATEQLTTSAADISARVTQATDVAKRALEGARSTSRTIDALNQSAQRIGEIVQLITGIAEQTNLLALNATIEAARAGDAGKGFAVVANEVKVLAGQTARATDEITSQITDVQSQTEASVKAIEEIVGVIEEMTGISASIAGAIEEQGAATREIARNVEEAAAGTEEVSGSVGNVTHAGRRTGEAAGRVQGAAHVLTEQQHALRSAIETFIGQLHAEATGEDRGMAA